MLNVKIFVGTFHVDAKWVILEMGSIVLVSLINLFYLAWKNLFSLKTRHST
jgi:hypothetical protein